MECQLNANHNIIEKNIFIEKRQTKITQQLGNDFSMNAYFGGQDIHYVRQNGYYFADVLKIIYLNENTVRCNHNAA